MRGKGGWLRCAIISIGCFFACCSAQAGFYYNTVSPGNVPWPGGIVPYVIDPALTAAQRQTYLDGLREWELAANVHFIPRTSETQYILFKYNPNGPNLVSGSNPQLVEINLLTRGQICHEMGHSFGLQHEHTRQDRNGFVTVLSGNITAGNEHFFNIDPNATAHGAYDFESVMHFGRDVFSVQPGVLDTLQAKPGFEKFQPRMGGLVLSKGDRAVMKFLYGAGPTLSSVVTNTSETGVGSLRAAMHYVSDNPGTTITFNIPTSDPNYANGVFTIRPTGYLAPLVIDGAIIDGTTQPGYAGNPLIVLEGSQILPVVGDVPGLLVYAANCTVKGLSFQRFPWVGLALLFSDAHHNSIRACWFGLDHSGTASAPNADQGVYIFSGAHSNTIGGTTVADRNVISGNGQYGVWISAATTTGNVVSGNYIGTSANGLAAVPNAFGGVIVTDGSRSNLIGGNLPGARNVISGNASTGVWLTGAGVDENTVRGNYIGLAANGTAALPNSFAGLYLVSGAENNLVADNVISGNRFEGIAIADPGTNGNTVIGNYIGTNAAGTAAVANGFTDIALDIYNPGVAVFGGAKSNLIGGTTGAARNVISGNAAYGVAVSGAGTENNLVRGNYIGTNAAGTAALGNGFADPPSFFLYAGAAIFGGATTNTIGGTVAGAANLICGNGGQGVLIADSGTNLNLVQGNFIGTNAAGSTVLGNNYAGVSIFAGAQTNTIGGTSVAARNIISGNKAQGIALFDAATTGNLLQGNFVGTNAAGTAPVPNTFSGVEFFAANGNLIGGLAGARNVISGNSDFGILFTGSGTANNRIEGNTIGGDATGAATIPNSFSGIGIFSDASSNSIGGTTAGTSNLITGNAGDGIQIGLDAIQNSIRGNSIFNNTGAGITLFDLGNNELPAPVLSAATLNLVTQVQGNLSSSVNTNFRLEFFASPPGNDEGQFFVGSANVITNGSGAANFVAPPINLAATVPANYLITATATDPNGNTSAFSAPVAVSSMDSDGDGMPDAWENAPGRNLNPNNAADANIDSDGDGLTNLKEFRAGTDPRSAASVLRITTLARSGNDLGLTFASVAGKTYRIESKDDLLSATWVLLEDQVFATGASTQILDSGAAALARRFYRVTLEP